MKCGRESGAAGTNAPVEGGVTPVVRMRAAADSHFDPLARARAAARAGVLRSTEGRAARAVHPLVVYSRRRTRRAFGASQRGGEGRLP